MSSHCHEGCISGTIHEGQPKGTIEKLRGLDVYVIGNRSAPRATIVIYSDIFGIPLPNNRLIADAYAASGEYLVYLPDFFQGDPVGLKLADVMIPADAAKQGTLSKYTGLLTQMPSFLKWMGRHGVDRTEKVCIDFLSALRKDTHGKTKVGIVGMCWGGRYALRAGLERNKITLKDGEKVSLVDAVVALHPSNLTLPADVVYLTVPTTFGWGAEDTVVSFKTKGHVEEIYAKAGKAGVQLPETVHKVYKPGRHGFSVRGNPDDAQERACLVDSEKQVLEWFGRWL